MSKAKRTRGVRYIAKSLRKYYPSRYKDSKTRMERARELYSEFKKSGTKPVIRNIKAKELEIKTSFKRGVKQVKPKDAPSLPLTLSQPTNYFNLTDYKELIYSVIPDIWFNSTISTESTPMVQSGTRDIDYRKYFAEFVNYINTIKDNPDTDDEYTDEWFVVCTEPEFDAASGLWISNIISCNSEGQPNDYGFKPTAGYVEPTTIGKKSKKGPQEPPKKEKQPEPPKKGKKTATGEKTGEKSDKIKLEELKIKQKEQEIQSEKVKAIQNAIKLYGDGLLTKLEFKQLMSDINKI